MKILSVGSLKKSNVNETLKYFINTCTSGI